MSGKNLKVNLIANTSQFKSAMAETSNQMKLINSEFKSAAAETDQYGNKLDTTGAKKKQLNGVIQQYTARIKAIKEEQKHWTAELEKGNITEEQHAKKQQELARRLNNTEAEMKRYEGQLKKLNAEGKATRMTFDEFDKKFRDVGKTMRDVGAKVGIAAGVGFMAMKKVLGDVVNEAKDFHAQMSEVQAISGATAEEMKVLTDQSKDLGKATKFTAQEASESQANLARAGFKVNEIYDAMPGLLDLAASSNLELGSAANITSNIIRTFGFEADQAGRVADVLAKGAATANTDVQGLGQAMEVAGPVANSLDIALEQVAASAGIMADAGIDGSKSGRMLRQGMLRLAKPTGAAADLLEDMGINAFDADGNMKSLDKVVAELEKGLKGQTKQQKAAALATIFGSESTAGWTVLLDKGSEELAKYTKELENSEGAAKEMAEVMQDNAQGAIIRMESALSGLKIELGEKLLPILSKAADWVGDLANKLSEMDEETITTIAQTGLLVTAVLGVTSVVGGLVAGIGAFMMVAGPIGLAIAGGTLLLGGLAAALYKSSLETKALAEEQKKSEEDARAYGEGLSEGTKKGVQGYKDLLDEAKIKMGELKYMSGEEAKKTVEEIRKAFSELGDQVSAELERQKAEITATVRTVFEVIGEEGAEQAQKINDKIVDAIDKQINTHSDAIKTIIDTQKEYGTNTADMPDDIRKAYSEAMNEVDEGMKSFAKSQDEMNSIMQAVVDNQGIISNKTAGQHIKNLNQSLDESLESSYQWRNEHLENIEQAHAQGYFEDEKAYRKTKSLLETTHQEMQTLARGNYKDSIKEISQHLDHRGEIVDLATGDDIKRQKEYVTTAAGFVIEMIENDEDYLERSKTINDERVKYAEDAHKSTLDNMEFFLAEYYRAMGESEQESTKKAAKMRRNIIRELEGGDQEAKKAGENKGKAVNDGLSIWKEKVKKTGKSVGTSAKLGLESVKTNNIGVNFSKGFEVGIKSRNSSVWSTAWNIGSSALSALKSSIASRSPSRLTGEEGINFTDGFTLAIDKGKKESVRASALVGKESVEALNEEVKGFKQSFGAIALAVEGNKQTLKVEHTLGSKFDEFASIFQAKENEQDGRIDKMLIYLEQMISLQTQQVTLAQQGQTIVMNNREVARQLVDPMDKELARKAYSRNAFARR